MRNSQSARGIMQRDPPRGLVDLGPGYLAPELIAGEMIAQWAADSLDRWGAQVLSYGADAGPWQLREKLAARVSLTAPGGGCTAARVIITGGTSAALDHLAMRFAREGRIVLTESLTYDLGRNIFSGWGVRTRAVPGPVNDLDVDEFAKAAKLATRSAGIPPAIYLIPTFHNPTGRVLSAERRLEVLGMAQLTGSLLVEDHAYSELYYESSPPPPLWANVADPEQVIGLYSFAKCLAPGLRVGWLVGGERLVAELAASPVRVSGGGPNHFAVMAVMSGLTGDAFESHVGTLRGQLRVRRECLLTVLLNDLPESFTVSHPAGGYFAWIGLPAGVSDERLLHAAEQQKVSFALGSRFGRSSGAVRLCFAGNSPEQIALGAAQFADVCKAVVSRG